MNFITKIFGAKKEKIEKNLDEVLKDSELSHEEILNFKITRLEIYLTKAKDDLKDFLKNEKRKK